MRECFGTHPSLNDFIVLIVSDFFATVIGSEFLLCCFTKIYDRQGLFRFI